MTKVLALLAISAVLAGCAGTAVSTVAPPVPTAAPGQTQPTAVPTGAPTDAPVATDEPTAAPTQADDGPATYGLGDVVTITNNGTDWANITVSNVSQHKSYGSGYLADKPEQKGNVFIQALVTYKALDNGVDYNPYDWQVFVNDEAVDNTAFVTEGPKPELNSGTLSKGRTAKGYVVYEVPPHGKVVMSYGGTFGDSAPVFEVVIRAK